MNEQQRSRAIPRRASLQPIQELAERQWAEWRATRRRLLEIGAFGGAGLALGLGAGRRLPLVSAAPAMQDEQPKSGGSLAMSLADSDVSSFDPPVPPDNMSIWTMLLFYEQLIRVAPDGVSLEPGLAESWQASDDGKTYTFKVREAQFHDGTPFTAEDAAFCILRAATKEGTPWQFIISVVESTEAPDPRTCVIHLKSPWAPFEADLAMFAASIFPKAAYDAQGDALFDKPIGTGPFMFESRTPDVEVVLKKNPSYWQPDVPYLDGLTFKVLQDSNARVLQLQGGDLDIATLVPYNQLEVFRSDPSYTVHPENVARIDIISINTTRPPFDDKKLRQAMNYAINKDAIIQNVLFGNGEMATSFLPKMPGRDPNSPGYPYDLEKAKALVAESAGKDGFSGEITANAADAVNIQVAQLVAAEPGADRRRHQGGVGRRQHHSPKALHHLRFRPVRGVLHDRHHRPGRVGVVRRPRRGGLRGDGHAVQQSRGQQAHPGGGIGARPEEAAGSVQQDPGHASGRRADDLPLLSGRKRRQPRLRQELQDPSHRQLPAVGNLAD